MFYTEWRPRPRFETTFRNGRPAYRAISEAAIRDPLKSSLDLFQCGAALLKQRRGLGELERDCASFGIMFVVNVGILAGITHRIDVLAECIE